MGYSENNRIAWYLISLVINPLYRLNCINMPPKQFINCMTLLGKSYFISVTGHNCINVITILILDQPFTLLLQFFIHVNYFFNLFSFRSCCNFLCFLIKVARLDPLCVGRLWESMFDAASTLD